MPVELAVVHWVCEGHAVGAPSALPEAEGEGEGEEEEEEAPSSGCRDRVGGEEGVALGGADCKGAVLAETERVEEVEGVGWAVGVRVGGGREGSDGWEEGLARGRAVGAGVGVRMGMQDRRTAEPGAPGEVMPPAPVNVTAPTSTAREVLM
jgi:hypothetical protein